MNNPWRFKSSRPHPNNTKGLITFGIIFLLQVYPGIKKVLTPAQNLCASLHFYFARYTAPYLD
ncbi:hypothetical protein PT2222_120253 [Paraburkholderia tropica]